MTACAKCGHDPDAAVVASWTLSLPKSLSSANLRTVNAGGARWRYAKERDEWTLLACHAFGRERVTAASGNTKRRVTIARLYSGRQREIDHDNLVAGCKALVDALVASFVIYDDRPAWLELHVEQQRTLDKNMTVVAVEELEAEALAAIGAKR